MIYTRLYDWQKKIINKFKDRQSFGLFLDMGLGKTPISLAFAEANHCTKIIIVTINSKVLESEHVDGSWLNWASQLDMKFNFYRKNQSFAGDFTSKDILLINYESLFSRNSSRSFGLRDNLTNFIQNCSNNDVALIIDESHKMKDLQSKQTKAIFMMQKMLKAKHCNVYTYLLTGTPFTQGFVDLYAQLKMLGCNITKGEFIENFCIRGNLPGLLGWQQPIVAYKNVDELYDLVHEYALTIKSDDVVDLPEKVFSYHPIDKTEHFDMFVNERMSVEAIKKEAELLNVEVDLPKQTGIVNNPFFRNIAYPELKWLAETNGTFWLRARQISIGFNGNASDYDWYDRSRLDKLEEFLRDNEDNYLLFYNYTPELLEIYDICEKLGYNIDIYCGEIKSMKNYEKFCRLSEAERLVSKKNIILANFASGSVGMNWQAYNKGIIFSTPIYKDYEQGIKRIHRLGQSKTVIWHVFYQKNWLDYSMINALNMQVNYTLEMFMSDLPRVNDLLESPDLTEIDE